MWFIVFEMYSFMTAYYYAMYGTGMSSTCDSSGCTGSW